MMGFKGTLKVDESRGIVYFHDQDGTCVLRVEGLPELRMLMDEGKQIDVRIMATLPRTDEYRDWADKEEAVVRAYRVKPLEQVRKELKEWLDKEMAGRPVGEGPTK